MRSAVEAALHHGWASKVVESLSQEAHATLAAGVDQSALVVLRQCSAGCSACCHTVAVDVTPLEALVVADYVQRTMSPEQLDVVRERLRLNAQRRAAMTADERSTVRMRCGLLGDDGLCQAYAARPLVCAGVYSLSRVACEAAASGDDLTAGQVPLDRPAKAWTMGVSGGLQRALVEAGLDGNLYELNSIVLCAIETTHAAARWLAKEDIFAQCICTDAHSWPRKAAAPLRVDAPHTAAPAPALLRPTSRKALRRR